MSRRRIFLSLALGALLMTASGYLISCADDEARTTDQAVLFGPVPLSNILLSTSCTHSSPRIDPRDVVARCSELHGTTTTITMPPPPTPPVSVQYSCLGWGTANPPYDVTKWYESFNAHPFSIFSNRPSTHATVEMVDSLNYVFQVRPKHPTDASLSPPLRISCTIDPGSSPPATISIAVNGTVPVSLTQITLAVPAPWVRPPTTMTISPSYKDNYNGINLLVPTPTTTWTSSNPAVATVSGGVVAGLTRGSFTITASAASGSISATTAAIAVQGCTSIGLSPAGAQNLTAGGWVNITATPVCDPYIQASSEPVTWSTSNASVVTVSGSGSGNHTGRVTAVAAGSATVKACAILLPLPVGGLCSNSVTVTVVPLPTIANVATTPTPPRQYTPFTLTINGSGFNPATAEMVYSQKLCAPLPSWCPGTSWPGGYSVRTATQLVIPNMVFSIADSIRIQVRNGPSGTLSNITGILIVPLY
jgi:hypothetical protein